jgi:hypothetical protein
MNNGTLLDVWESFENSGSKDISLYQSALFRFTLPGLGGCKPSGARLSSKEIAAALKTLTSIAISPDIEIKLREAQKQTFALLNTPKERQRQPRYYLNQFIDWSLKSNFFPSAKLPEEKQDYIFYPEIIKKIRITNRKQSNKFTFSFDAGDYATERLQPEQVQQHLQRISEEFTSFEKYLSTVHGNRQRTIENRVAYLQLFLGWFYREKGVSLSEISLSKLVPFIRLNFKMNEFDSEESPLLSRMIANAKAQDNIRDEANRLVNLMEEFFLWLENPPSLCSKHMYIDALIAYSKCVYRHETDETMALNFEDIPLINRLRVFHRKAENCKNKNSYSLSKHIPWHEVLDVLEKLRFEANLQTIKGNNSRKERGLSPRAKSLQEFVLLGFFTLVPPSRQRPIRELELGRTLKYGTFENGRFTSAEKMANPSEAKYYIHLQPEDYKTGDTYDEWLGEFPNTEFSDGSKFYDYLNRWLFRGYQDENGEWHGMREVIAARGEKTVFVKHIAGNSHCGKSMHKKITNIFTRWTGVPISPHDIRHIYRTYIELPETGATEQEKESAAYWMRHSSQTAKQTYSHLNNQQKLQAGAQMGERLNRQLLKGKN